MEGTYPYFINNLTGGFIIPSDHPQLSKDKISYQMCPRQVVAGMLMFKTLSAAWRYVGMVENIEPTLIGMLKVEEF